MSIQPPQIPNDILIRIWRYLYSQVQPLRQTKINVGINLIYTIMTKGVKSTWDVDVRIYSQFGEDGILFYLMNVLEIQKPRILEIGAGIFRENNSRFLVESLGASVVAVDSDKKLLRKISPLEVMSRNHVIPLVYHVTPDNINLVVSFALDEMQGIDVMSFDIDGNDYWVIQQANLDSVSVVVAEFNPVFGCTNSLTVSRDDYFDRFKYHHSGLLFGCSITALVVLMARKGFVFIGSNRAGNNAFFVKQSLSNRREIENITKNLSPISSGLHTDWRFREERDPSGRLTYNTINDSKFEVQEELVFHLEDERNVKLNTVW